MSHSILRGRSSTTSSTTTATTTRPSHHHQDIVQPSYIEQYTNKQDLIQRLRTLIQTLRSHNGDNNQNNNDETMMMISIDNDLYRTGLDGLCTTMIQTKWIHHKDKQIRLYIVLVCMELLCLYAPELPTSWDMNDTSEVFQAIFIQLANFKHCTHSNSTSTNSSSSSSTINNTANNNNPNYDHYVYILSLFAEVKIGVVLVEWIIQHPSPLLLLSQQRKQHQQKRKSTNAATTTTTTTNNKKKQNNKKKEKDGKKSTTSITNTTACTDDDEIDLEDVELNDGHDDDDNDDDDNDNQNTNHEIRVGEEEKNKSSSIHQMGMELLCDLFHTLFTSIRMEHSQDIYQYMNQTMISCLDEFLFQNVTIPIPVLDEILLAIGSGPILYVVPHTTMTTTTASNGTTNTKNRRGHKENNPQNKKISVSNYLVEQTNPMYELAATLIRTMLNRITTPLSQCINGLLNHTEHIVNQSKISTTYTTTATTATTSDLMTATGIVPSTAATSECNVYQIILELHRVAPPLLTTILGTVSQGLSSEQISQRLAVTQLLGSLWTNDVSLTNTYHPIYREWLSRHNDVHEPIRKVVVEGCLSILRLFLLQPPPPQQQPMGQIKEGKQQQRQHLSTLQQQTRQQQPDLQRIMVIESILIHVLTTDPNLDIRLATLHPLCDMIYQHYQPQSHMTLYSTSSSSSNKQGHEKHISLSTQVIQAIASRVKSKNKVERKDALTGLGQIYWKCFVLVQLQKLQQSLVVPATTMDTAGSTTTFTTTKANQKNNTVITEHRRKKRKSNENDPKEPDDDDDDDQDLIDDSDLSTVLDVLHEVCHLPTIMLSSNSPTAGNKVHERLDNNKRNGRGQRKSTSDIRSDWTDLEERFGWIPEIILEALCYTDTMDSDMKSRVIHILDNVLLGSTSTTTMSSSAIAAACGDGTTTSSNMNRRLHHPVTQAVGLSMFLSNLVYRPRQHLLTSSTLTSSTTTSDGLNQHPQYTMAYRNMIKWFEERAHLQRILHQYLTVRTETREYRSGTEEHLTSNARALELLDMAAALTAPVITKGSSMNQSEVLAALHNARDKHIFRILSTICYPCHTTKAKMRALDELPKRTKPLGEPVSEWIRSLVRRCTMGSWLNMDTIHYSASLAQKSFQQGDLSACAMYLMPIKLASQTFPGLCGVTNTFEIITALFARGRSISSASQKKRINDLGIITDLSTILSASASSSVSAAIASTSSPHNRNEELQNGLIRLCTRDGTPEQSRSAVFTLAKLASQGHASDVLENQKKTHDDVIPVLETLLRSLTVPSKLRVNGPGLTSALAALSALASCAPQVFHRTSMGERALEFALDTLLLGQPAFEGNSDIDEHPVGAQDDSELDDVDEIVHDEYQETPHSTRKRSRLSKGAGLSDHRSPQACTSLLEDESLSLTSRQICAAIDFITAYIRSIQIKRNRPIGSRPDAQAADLIPKTRIQSFFDLLVRIIHNKGLPPSMKNMKLCKARQDRAALRQSAGIHLLRLCDTRLGLEKTFLSPSMWHILSSLFLDEERIVREALMEELSQLLKGTGVYGEEGSGSSAQAPALRFLAYIVLCSDGGHGSDHSAANGSAANVAKSSSVVKSSAFHCTLNMRKVSDAAYAQCRALGKEAESRFESQLKMLVMPEYSVPYAIHLLSHRRETPSAGGIVDNDETSAPEANEIIGAVDDESYHRVLRKRLKLLFEPLVQSLGDGADNITFLLRIMEVLVKQYRPVDVSLFWSTQPGLPGRLSIESTASRVSINPGDTVDVPDESKGELLLARLRTVCSAAREVLLSFVKKDVNLSQYPGTIQLPKTLFERIGIPKQANAPTTLNSEAIGSRKNDVSAVRSSHRAPSQGKRLSRSRIMDSPKEMNQQGRVHFSPEIKVHMLDRELESSKLCDDQDSSEHFSSDLSPIAKSTTPDSSTEIPTSISVATLGLTPPSMLKNNVQDTQSTQGSSEIVEPENLSSGKSNSRNVGSAHGVVSMEKRQLRAESAAASSVQSSKSSRILRSRRQHKI